MIADAISNKYKSVFERIDSEFAFISRN